MASVPGNKREVEILNELIDERLQELEEKIYGVQMSEESGVGEKREIIDLSGD